VLVKYPETLPSRAFNRRFVAGRKFDSIDRVDLPEIEDRHWAGWGCDIDSVREVLGSNFSRTPIILTEIFRGFPEIVREISGTECQCDSKRCKAVPNLITSMKNVVFWMCRCVALVWTDVSEERIASIFRV
jgi:hypothetical protein